MSDSVNPDVTIKLSDLVSLRDDREGLWQDVRSAEREYERVLEQSKHVLEQSKDFRARIAELEATKQPWDREAIVQAGNLDYESSGYVNGFSKALDIIEARYAPPQAKPEKPAFDVEKARSVYIDAIMDDPDLAEGGSIDLSQLAIGLEALAREFTLPVAAQRISERDVIDILGGTLHDLRELSAYEIMEAVNDWLEDKLAVAQGEQQPPTGKESLHVRKIEVTDEDVDACGSGSYIGLVRLELNKFVERANARMQTMREVTAEDITEFLRRGTRGVSDDAEWLNARLRGDAK